MYAAAAGWLARIHAEETCVTVRFSEIEFGSFSRDARRKEGGSRTFFIAFRDV
jgi:hypothetical protein